MKGWKESDLIQQGWKLSHVSMNRKEFTYQRNCITRKLTAIILYNIITGKTENTIENNKGEVVLKSIY